MEPDLSKLDTLLKERGVDGYLVLADSDEADQRYLSGFDAPDDFLTLYDGAVHLLVSGLEYGRARKEARAATVERTADFDARAKLREHGETEGTHRLYAEFLESHGVESVATPTAFPLGAADGLRERGIDVEPDDEDTIGRIRATKTDEEVEWMRESQRANEKAMATAEGRRVPEISGQMPKCLSENSGVQTVFPKYSQTETSWKNAALSKISTPMMPTVVSTDRAAQANRTFSIPASNQPEARPSIEL